jgi:hypothetical protein
MMFRGQAARFVLASVLLLGLLLSACSRTEAKAEIRDTVEGFFSAISDQDFDAAEQYFIDMPEGSLSLLNPQAPPIDALRDYEIRSVTVQDARAEAEVAIPGAENTPGTTVLTFRLERVDERWLLREDIQARVELDEVE